MGNLFNGFDEEQTEPKALQMPKELLIGGDQERPAIDVVYDALVTKVEYYESLIREAEPDIKCWKEMKAELEKLIKAIDRRK